MASRPKLKTAFKNARTIGPLHSAGPVAITPDAKRIVTCVEEDVLLTEVSTGIEICRFAADSQSVTALCISPSSKHLIVFRSSFTLFIYELPFSSIPIGKPIQAIRSTPRAHQAPVHVCKVDPTSTYLASGSADGVVKVWDILRGYVTHVFKGHGGVVSALAFNYPRDASSIIQEQKMQLITASVDTRIRIFELSATASRSDGALKPEAVLMGHDSVPRGLDVTPDGKWLVSGGRDSVVLIWDLTSNGSASTTKRKKGNADTKSLNPVLVKTIPILERVEAVGFISKDEELAQSSSGPENLCIYTGGEKGVVRVWDVREGTVLCTMHTGQSGDAGEQEDQRQIVDAMYAPSVSAIVSVHADQNILFHSLSTQSLTRQLVGFNDEIVDATFLSPSSDNVEHDSHIALATNSSLIRIYSTSSLDARLLSGHKEIVLCLDRGAGGKVFASGSKDRSARIWAPADVEGLETGPALNWGCIAICEGHAESVGAIAMSRKFGSEGGQPLFMFTGSQDRTIKMWDLSHIPLRYEPDWDEEVVKCKSLTTLKAHEKDINSLDVAPNDKLLVSGSQDRTAKVYEIDCATGSGGKISRGEIRLIGVCKGHKRGVWSVKFGRTERVLATGSGDKTVKLWSLEDFTCVKTFEGHTNSVLRVDFLNAGMQLISTASDGLVKLWNVRDEECMATLDNHQDKVWALAISADERTIVSGAADSVVTFWEDCTEERENEKEGKRVQMVQKEQDFVNYLSLHDYKRAIELALSMEQPGRLLSLFQELRSSFNATQTNAGNLAKTGNVSVDEAIRTLALSDLARLFRYVRNWNANAKTSTVAQDLLYAIMKLRSVEDVIKAFNSELATMTAQKDDSMVKEASGSTALKELVDALIPYTERHLSRLERLVQESYVVDYILAEMDDGMFDWADGSVVGTSMGVDAGVEI